MKIDGNKIKKIRLSLGKSQEEFGRLFNPPAAKSAVCRWEKGHGARKGRLKKIAISLCIRVTNTLMVARLLSLQRSIITLLSR